MPLLSEAEFQRTFANPMTRVAQDEQPLFDFWPYFDQIPSADFSGHDCASGNVTYVYRNPSGRFDHVLVDSETRDVFMVLVLDRDMGAVLGHKLLDLPALYGLKQDREVRRADSRHVVR
jgi:hypothetical protein